MCLTNKEHYAVTALLHLALNDRTPMVLEDIAKRQEISLSYLSRLFCCMRKAGLVKSIRGPGGGYILAKPANNITISEILDSVNNKTKLSVCHSLQNDTYEAKYLYTNLWNLIDQEILIYLSKITLTDVIALQIASIKK